MVERLIAAAKSVVEAALNDCIGGGCSASVNGCARCPYEQPEMRELREAVTAAMCAPGPQTQADALALIAADLLDALSYAAEENVLPGYVLDVAAAAIAKARGENIQ